MKTRTGFIPVAIFTASFAGVVLFGYVLPWALGSSGFRPGLSPLTLNGLLFSGVLAALSAPSAWRGVLKLRSGP